MNRSTQRLTAAIRRAALLFALAGLAGCVTVPTRPYELLPLVEVELNNSPTHRDDVVSIFSTVQMPSRMRITNVGQLGVKNDVPVVVSNIGGCGSYCGALLFATALTGPSVQTLPLILPKNGDWVPFVVRGDPSRASATAKDAVLQIREDRPAGNVLARQGVFVADANPIAAQNPLAIVEIGQTGITLDDYLTWAPTPASVRLAVPNAVGAPLSVTLRNAAPVGAQLPGRVLFGLPLSNGEAPPPSAMTPTLSVTLDPVGGATEFFIAGEPGRPSDRDKDAIIEVVDPAKPPAIGLLENIGVMVRIRKNANQLSDNERDRLLAALDTLRTATGQYADYVQINGLAGTQAYSASSTVPSPAFLPWHRLLLLRFERALQGLDPSVALPYWRYDEAAPNVFSQAFMGESQTGAGLPTILTSASNPLSGWSIQRMSSFPPLADPKITGPAACWTAPEANILVAATQFLNGLSGFWQVEHVGTEHAMWAASGQCLGLTGSWLAQPATAAQDPLFFLLHANTDRLWAKWQQQQNRFSPALPDSYVPAACAMGAGQCLRDPMWPWSSVSSPGGQFPTGIGRYQFPPANPTPADAIGIDRSYGWNGSQWDRLNSGLGYSYDDVPPTQ